MIKVHLVSQTCAGGLILVLLVTSYATQGLDWRDFFTCLHHKTRRASSILVWETAQVQDVSARVHALFRVYKYHPSGCLTGVVSLRRHIGCSRIEYCSIRIDGTSVNFLILPVGMVPYDDSFDG